MATPTCESGSSTGPMSTTSSPPCVESRSPTSLFLPTCLPPGEKPCYGSSTRGSRLEKATTPRAARCESESCRPGSRTVSKIGSRSRWSTGFRMVTSRGRRSRCYMGESAQVALEFADGPYSGSRTEPDFFFQVNDQILPTLVVESGWSESKEQLHDDMNLLLVGGNGAVKVVILVTWTKLQGGRVSGHVELFMRDQHDMPRLEQSETVFPRPTTAGSQRLGIRRSDLFGPALLAGRNGNDVLYLDVERLRDHATRALGFMDLVPA
ncbi:hypothetical protein VTN02DRAFT_937 [Thermoascus thermophilus]